MNGPIGKAPASAKKQRAGSSSCLEEHVLKQAGIAPPA
jgi:hypothetical protein